jgi:hypothetical protein
VRFERRARGCRTTKNKNRLECEFQAGLILTKDEKSVTRTVWEGRPKKVTALYLKMPFSFLVAPKYRGARETLWESAGTIRQG